MKTTITGELSISMLIEEITLSIPEVIWLQSNTDGISVKIPRRNEKLYFEICSRWEKLTKLTLEHAFYKQMIIRDVNNYIGEYIDGSTKLKGAFEIFQELHKNPSMRIVPIALQEYFINNIPISETIHNHDNIFNFCCELKTNKDWDGNYKYLTPKGIVNTKLGKVTRYYVSGGSGILQKKNITDGREIGVCVGNGVVVFNKYEKKEMKDYKINYDYYIKECFKIINQIEDKQLKLF